MVRGVTWSAESARSLALAWLLSGLGACGGGAGSEEAPPHSHVAHEPPPVDLLTHLGYADYASEQPEADEPSGVWVHRSESADPSLRLICVVPRGVVILITPAGVERARWELGPGVEAMRAELCPDGSLLVLG